LRHGVSLISSGRARESRPRALAAVGAFIVALAAVGPAFAADLAPGRIPTVTRLVKVYADRETALAQAIRAGDKAAVERTLADDFELRIGARPAQPVPRDDFVQALVRTREAGGEISAMAVHDLGATAIASFTQGHGANAIFVVDVWRKYGEDWKLAIRYANPAGATRTPIPGADGPPPDTIPKKY
jgi:hypothetical protein